MFVSAALSSYSAAVQLSHKSSRFQAPDTAADIIIAYRDLELHSMFCPILLPPYGQLQPMLKTIHLLCITVSVGRSRSVKKANQDRKKRSKKIVDILKKCLHFKNTSHIITLASRRTTFKRDSKFE